VLRRKDKKMQGFLTRPAELRDRPKIHSDR
jgi:hypothetical protein